MAAYKIFSGTSHPDLAKAIAKKMKTRLGALTIKRFACNEIYVKLGESVRGKHVYVLQTCTSQVNEDYMELFLLCDAFKRGFAKSVHVIIPHFGYARQDRVSEPREALSARLMADLLMRSGCDHVITFTLHSDQIQGFFKRQVDNINARRLFADHFIKKKLRNAVVVSPDAGGAKQAKKFADDLGFPLAILNKVREGHNVSEVSHVVGDVQGKVCILYDDMIDTGGSVVSAKEALLKAGAHKDVYLAATHGVFSPPAEERLNGAGFKEVVITDSIPLGPKRIERITVLSLAPLIASVVANIQRDRSVSEVYEAFSR